MSLSSPSVTINDGRAATISWAYVSGTGSSTGTNCSTLGTDASVAANFTGNWPAVGGPLAANGIAIVQAAASNATTSVAYTFGVTCHDSVSGAIVVGTAAMTIKPATIIIPNNCGNTVQMSDVGNLSRVCSGNVTRAGYGSDIPGADLTSFAGMYGTWPGQTGFAGLTTNVLIGVNQYIALELKPNPAHAIKLSANSTWMGQNTISVSKLPGQFSAANAICVFNRGASNSPVISSSAWPSVCQLDPNTTYYINMSLLNSANASACGPQGCYISFTLGLVN